MSTILYGLLLMLLPILTHIRCCRSSHTWMSMKFENRSTPSSVVDDTILRICEIVLDARPHKEVYLVRADTEEAEGSKIAVLLHKRTTLVMQTFSHITRHAHRQPTTCRSYQPQILYTLLVALEPTIEVAQDLMYHPRTYPDTILILMIDERLLERLKRIVRNVWKKRYIFRVLIVVIEVDKYRLRPQTRNIIIFDPHVECEQGGQFRNSSIPVDEILGSYLTRTLKTLNGCSMTISMYEREQTAVLLNNATFTGQDGKLIDLLKEKMNFRPVIHLMKGPNGKMTYGYKKINSTYVGTFSELMNGTSDVALNGHFLKEYQCKIVELTRHITSDRVCMLTPKAGIIPPIITVFKSFQSEVWAMIIVTYVVVVATFYAWTALDSRYLTMTGRSSLAGCIVALDIYRIMVASPLSRKVRKHYEKVMFAFCWFFSTVILNSFQGSLVTFLNTPMHFPDLNTFDDLIASGLPLRTASVSFRELLLSDPNLSKLEKKVYFSTNVSAVENFQGRFAGFQRINVYNLKYFNDIRYILNEKESRLLHTMRQCLSSYFISYAIRKHSPYKRRIDHLISGVEHAGLIIKWNDDSAKYIFEKYQLVTTKDSKSSKIFSLRDLEVAFFVCICGLVISILVLIAEIIVYRYHNARRGHKF